MPRFVNAFALDACAKSLLLADEKTALYAAVMEEVSEADYWFSPVVYVQQRVHASLSATRNLWARFARSY